MTHASQADLKVMKALGRAHVNANRLDQALDVFAEILTSYPEDVETHIILGDCYLAANQPEMAARLYQQAKTLAPENSGIETRIALVEEEAGLSQTGPPLLDEAALDTLLVSLTGKGKHIDEEQLQKASDLLEMIIDSDHPALAVSEQLDEIESLLPALLKLNIRQARSDGQSDLAENLQSLLESFYLQAEADGSQPPWMTAAVPGLPQAEWESLDGIEIGILIDPAQEETQRITLAGEALQELGCVIARIETKAEVSAFRGQAILIHNPHTSKHLMSMMAMAAAAERPILVDLDGSAVVMLEAVEASGSAPDAGISKFFTSALLMADTVTTSSLQTKKAFDLEKRTAEYIPHAWSRTNPLWEKVSPKRDTLNIGWIGAPDELANIAGVRRALLRILREFPQTCIVIGENPAAYQLFDSLPESRRMYVPHVQAEDYPYSLAQIDIMLDPVALPDKHHNDHRLVEAGIRSIPWIASPCAAARTWGSGGLLADDIEQWHSRLRQLVLDAETRIRLGRDGQIHAKGREIRKVTPGWLKAFQHAIRAKQTY